MKNPEYYSNDYSIILQFIPNTCKTILDIGCAYGFLGKNIKNRTEKELVGIELDRDAAKQAEKYFDKVVVGDIETLELDLKEHYFDCIIFADILEHLKDPWTLLKKIKKYLKPEGVLVASIPNVKHYTVLRELLLGLWNYKPAGILDDSHLRFFTLQTIQKMFQDAGYTINSVKPTRYNDTFEDYAAKLHKLEQNNLNETLAQITKLLYSDKQLKTVNFSKDYLKTLMHFQYVVIAKPSN